MENLSSSYTVHRFMRSTLGLLGSELQVYALIFSFCRDGRTGFSGSREYIAYTTGLSVSTVTRALARLVRDNYLLKEKRRSRYSDFSYSPNTELIEKAYAGGK